MNSQHHPNTRQLRFIPLTAGVIAIAAASNFPTLESHLGSTPSHPQKSSGRRSIDPPAMAKGKFGQDLFLAIDHGDLKMVKSLLQKGADPNSRNGLELTPLYMAAASHQADAMQALLKAGAKPEAESPYGTPLLFAAASGNLGGAKTLLSLGSNANASRGDGMTALMMAATSGVPELVEELLKNRADANAKDDFGASSLSLAARGGHYRVGQILIEAGAKVNDSDNDGQTPLMGAAVTGHAEFVKLLLQKGANANSRDEKGRSALILAASYGDSPAVIQALLDGGADPKLTDGRGQTAATIAATRGYAKSAAILGKPSLSVKVTTTPQEATLSSLKVLQTSMLKFGQNTNCISCHHEGLGRMTTGLAKDRGVAVDPKLRQLMSMRVSGAMNAMMPLHQGALKSPEVMKQVPLIEINEVATSYTWFLAGKALSGEKSDKAAEAMAMVLAKQQSKEGFWSFSGPREPMQSSFFTFTALAVRSLKAFGPKAESKEISSRIQRAKNWLLTAPTKTTEDRAMRLLGLKWAGVSPSQLQKFTAEVRADQSSMGGWSQLPNMQNDAYATGQALYALHEGGGVSVTDSAYKRGVQFLLRTQDADGSWFTNKRSIPANNYFNAGFPNGESQYASFNATAWATLALLETLPAKRGVSTR